LTDKEGVGKRKGRPTLESKPGLALDTQPVEMGEAWTLLWVGIWGVAGMDADPWSVVRQEAWELDRDKGRLMAWFIKEASSGDGEKQETWQGTGSPLVKRVER
jgi:hypothetical protein